MGVDQYSGCSPAVSCYKLRHHLCKSCAILFDYWFYQHVSVDYEFSYSRFRLEVVAALLVPSSSASSVLLLITISLSVLLVGLLCCW